MTYYNTSKKKKIYVSIRIKKKKKKKKKKKIQWFKLVNGVFFLKGEGVGVFWHRQGVM